MKATRCPVCDGFATVRTAAQSRDYKRQSYVVCLRFDCRLSGPRRATARAAIEAWNGIRRTTDKRAA